METDRNLLTWADATLRPYFICRLSGVPVGYVERLRSNHLVQAAAALRDSDVAFQCIQQSLLEILFGVIGSCRVTAERRLLVRIKRDVFNSRPIDAPPQGLLPEEAAAAVAAYRDAALALRQEEHNFRALFGEEAREATAQLLAGAEDEDFQKGIALSSPALTAALAAQRRSANSKSARNRTKLQRGVLRYLTRMAMKATPFGTFSAIVPGTLSIDAEPFYMLAGNPSYKQTSIRLNKSIYGVLSAHLKRHPVVRRHLRVQLNPTLREEDDRFVFLAATNGLEIFQRVGKTPVLTTVLRLLKESHEISLGKLCSQIRADPLLDTTDEEVEGFVDRLLSIGMFRLSTGVREQDPDWDLPLRTLLRQIDDPQARTLDEFLLNLRGLADLLATTNAAARPSTLRAIQRLLDAELERLALQIPTRKALPVYEDATAKASLSVSLVTAGSDWVRDLVDYVLATLPLAVPRQEQAEMRHFFDAHYGPEERAVPLLTFYEDFYREHYKQHLQREREYRVGNRTDAREGNGYNFLNPFDLPFIDALRSARRQLTVLIGQRWAEAGDAEEIVLQKDDFDRVSRHLPLPSIMCRSVSIFGQLIPGRCGRGMLIMPSGLYLLGFGKYFSRFLYLLPSQLSANVFADNQSLSQDDLLAEICGDAHFNANLHPPLLPWEISYPTGEGPASDNQVHGWDLVVRRSSDDCNALQLLQSSTGRRVIPIDLGFLNLQRRPPLYQLLARFGPPMVFDIGLPSAPPPAQPSSIATQPQQPASSPTRSGMRSKASITRRPRIRFGKGLILARQCWIVPAELLPVPSNNEHPADYFRRVHRWREAHQVPLEVFARVWPNNLPAAAETTGEPLARQPDEELEYTDSSDPTQNANGPERHGDGRLNFGSGDGGSPTSVTAGSRDYRKPQYIDFANPLLVELFAHLGSGLEDYTVILEERLPGRDALPVWKGSRFATEMIFQLDLPGTPGSKGAVVSDSERCNYV